MLDKQWMYCQLEMVNAGTTSCHTPHHEALIWSSFGGLAVDHSMLTQLAKQASNDEPGRNNRLHETHEFLLTRE